MTIEAAEKLITETLGAVSSAISALGAGYSAVVPDPNYIAPVNPPESFPYRTKTAEKVWAIAQVLIDKYPECSEHEILAMAMEKSGVPPIDLAPEDWRLLEIAIEARKNGTTGLAKPKGQDPGGPANTDAATSIVP